MKIIKTVCHRDCPDTCFMDVTVDRGKIIATRGSTENPVTGGFLCPRGNGDPQRVYSKNRVLHPHVKAESGESGTFSRVSWDAALSTVSGRIQATLDTHGRESLLLYDYPGNTGFLAWHFAKRLWSALGATTSDYTLCSSSGHAGIGLHYGLSYGLQLEDMAASTVILFWGKQCQGECVPHMGDGQPCQKITREPSLSVSIRAKARRQRRPTSGSSPIPGSDVALCYGIARYLIEKGGVDLGFIGRWTTGFPKYAETAMEWTTAAGRTGIPASPGHCVAQIGELLMTHRPAAFMIGLGLQKSMQGAEAARAVALLPALLGLHRGFQYSNARGTGYRLADDQRTAGCPGIGARWSARWPSVNAWQGVNSSSYTFSRVKPRP